MKYQIIGKDNFIYGMFPTKLCADLALKGMLTLIDDLRIETCRFLVEQSR